MSPSTLSLFSDSHDSKEPRKAPDGPLSRSLLVVFLLGLFWPGLGHIFAGYARRGLLMLVVGVLVLLPSIMQVPILLSFSKAAVIIGLSLSVLLGLVVPIDGMLVARRRPAPRRGALNRGWIYIGYAVVVMALVPAAALALEGFLWFKEVRYPTVSMTPTLLVGDWIVVDTRTSAAWNIHRGDVVLSRDPRTGSLFVRRVIGLGGETLEIRDRTVYIDGRALEESYVMFETLLSPEAIAQMREGLPASSSSQDRQPDNIPFWLRRYHQIDPVRVPLGTYFVMGDNRDESRDSRSFGPIAEDAIQGRVIAVHWSERADGSGLRWERIGQAIPRVDDSD